MNCSYHDSILAVIECKKCHSGLCNACFLNMRNGLCPKCYEFADNQATELRLKESNKIKSYRIMVKLYISFIILGVILSGTVIYLHKSYLESIPFGTWNKEYVDSNGNSATLEKFEKTKSESFKKSILPITLVICHLSASLVLSGYAYIKIITHLWHRRDQYFLSIKLFAIILMLIMGIVISFIVSSVWTIHFFYMLYKINQSNHRIDYVKKHAV
ncbi:MAG: hypothetical protein JEZ08_22400 [Clostridiales bacterium]|nr:hypothetical protein [Clostridiales bacterium]